MRNINYRFEHENLIAMFFFSVLICLVCAISANGAAPPNDNLSGAQTLSGASGTVNNNNIDATREQGEFSHSIINGTLIYRTVWFQWTAPASKPVTFEVTSSSQDMAMAVYTGANHPLTGVNLNNNTTGNRPRIEFMANAGTSYKIVVGLYNNENIQGDNFTLGWAQNNNPTNDNFANAMNLETFLSGSVAATTQSATKEQGEPTHIAGNRSVWFNYTNNQSSDYSITFSTLLSFNASLDTTISVYTGSSIQTLTPVVKNDNMSTTNRSSVTFLAKAGVTYRIAVDEGFNPNEGDITLNWGVTGIKGYTDFATNNGASEIVYDLAADITVFRPSNGVWYWLNSTGNGFNAIQFGLSGDTPVQGDYDGDGRTDIAVTRNTAGGKIWYIFNSFDSTYTILQWGLSEDKPVTGDYDFDGRVDIAVFRPSSGTWYIRRSTDSSIISKQFGFSTDIPVSCDFAGTNPGTDIAVFRPANGTWYILTDSNTIFIPFGAGGDKPVVGDYNDDGKSDVAVYRPSTGTWYVLRSGSNQLQVVQWGLPGDIPMTGDYDNNTNDLYDFAVYRPSEGRWYILRSEETVIDIRQFGLSGDIPASSPALLAQ